MISVEDFVPKSSLRDSKKLVYSMICTKLFSITSETSNFNSYVIYSYYKKSNFHIQIL